MSGPWSSGFSSGFGPLQLVSGRDPGLMAILGKSATQTLLWDFSETQCFYLLSTPSDFGTDFNADFGPGLPLGLYKITPAVAQAWFRTGTVVYDPFATGKPSTLL